MKNEGWAYNTTNRNKTHYYKNGISLCGKAKEEKHFTRFDKDRVGSKYFEDCEICVKKQKEALHETNVGYKKYDY